MSATPPLPRPDEARFLSRVLTVAGVFVAVATVWTLRNLLLLLFGAAVLATALRALAESLEKFGRVPARWSFALAFALTCAAFAGLAALLGGAFAERADELARQLPDALRSFEAWVGRYDTGRWLLEGMRGLDGADVPWARLAGYTGVTLTAAGSVLLLLVMALYLAANPREYREGLVRFLPERHQENGGRMLQSVERSLRRWLLAQLMSMTFLGVSTAVGLALLGVPLALSLGVTTALAAFVPFFGALAAGALSVLFGFLEGPATALYVALLFVGLQQVEEYVLQPVVQRWSVRVPPVAGLVATVAWSVLFGLPGLLLSGPLTVAAAVIAVRVRDA